jgi:hypothetical protein
MAYMARTIKAGLQLRKCYPGNVSHECIQHDNWCPLATGKAASPEDCICDPDILVLCEAERFEVDKDGNLIAPRAGLVCRHGFERK